MGMFHVGARERQSLSLIFGYAKPGPEDNISGQQILTCKKNSSTQECLFGWARLDKNLSHYRPFHLLHGPEKILHPDPLEIISAQ
jgi:hypothetical protein